MLSENLSLTLNGDQFGSLLNLQEETTQYNYKCCTVVSAVQL